MNKDQLDRFNSHVMPITETGCHIWIGSSGGTQSYKCFDLMLVNMGGKEKEYDKS